MMLLKTLITMKRKSKKSSEKKICKIVVGLTKISKLAKEENVSLQAENFRKMVLTLNDDVRVILIKLLIDFITCKL